MFVELITDAEYPKVAFTKADGETELYGECELFDVSEKLGIYHVSRDGWVINANTSIYMYYDKDHADNNTYIGAIGARTEVWDGDFKLVCHMVDDNGNVDDSTSNNNDGAKLGVGEPAETAGKIGQGQDFDGIDDRISVTRHATLEQQSFTYETWVNMDDFDGNQCIFSKDKEDGHSPRYYSNHIRISGVDVEFFWNDTVSQHRWITVNHDMNVTTWYYLVVTYTSGEQKININTVEKGTDSRADTILYYTSELVIGDARNLAYPMAGLLDEIRFSSTVRSLAWQKGTYNSGLDALLTYGSQEPPAEEVNAIFFGANF